MSIEIAMRQLLQDSALTYTFDIQVRVTKGLQAQVFINQPVDYHHYHNA